MTTADEKMPPGGQAEPAAAQPDKAVPMDVQNTSNEDESMEHKWKAGDRINAVWAGNGCYYGAVVSEVHPEAQTVRVQWDDKEETHQTVSFDQIQEPSEESKAWSMQRIHKRSEVRDTAEKGRCLFTNKACHPGDIVFIEKPTLVALPALADKLWAHLTKLHEAQPLNLGTVTFHFAALLSQLTLDPMSIDVILDKYVPEPDEEPGEDALRIIQSLQDDMHEALNTKDHPVDPRRLQRLVSAWRYNSFGHHKEDGLVLYNRISMCSHSCDPTCCWSYGDDDAFVLRARIALKEGDELTISYLQDEDLLKSTIVRRQKLQNWRFTCACPRCNLNVDNGRGFKCRRCRFGVLFATATARFQPCNTCGATPSEEETQMLLHYEEEYVVRVDNLDKTDVPDVQAVYDAANQIFERHWILYVMDTYLWEAHREKKIREAIEHQRRRVEFHEHYYYRPTFILAWCHEELGDCLRGEQYHQQWFMQAYNKAYYMLTILCGTGHQYTASPYNKMYQVQNAAPAAGNPAITQ